MGITIEIGRSGRASLFLVGDVHGHIPEYLALLASLPPSSCSIALGDLYLGRSGIKLPVLSPEHKFLRGNHDSPSSAAANPSYLGNFGYVEEHDIFFLSGAITASWRVLGNSKYWYRDEELSEAELGEAVELYAKVTPRTLIAHEFPQEAVPEILRGLIGNYFAAKTDCIKSRCRALQKMIEVWRPESFYGGHYHISRTFDLNGTRYRCLRELEICKVPRLSFRAQNQKNIELG
jgi:hypothetical protein